MLIADNSATIVELGVAAIVLLGTLQPEKTFSWPKIAVQYVHGAHGGTTTCCFLKTPKIRETWSFLLTIVGGGRKRRKV